MVRRFVLLLAVLLSPVALAEAFVPISDPVWSPASATVLVGDDSAHYAFGFGMMRIAPDGTRIDDSLRQIFPGSVRSAAVGLGMVVMTVEAFSSPTVLAAVTTDHDILWTRTVPAGGALFFDGAAFVHLTLRNADFVLTRWDGAGNELSRRTVLTMGPSSSGKYAAARAGDGIAIVWAEGDSVYASFVNGAGNASTRRRIGPNSRPGRIAVATNGRDAVAVWTASPSPGTLYAARFDARGLKNGPVAIGTDAAFPAVLWDGRVYRVAWDTATAVETVELGAGLAITGRATLFPRARLPHDDERNAPRMSVANGHVLLARDGDSVVVAAGESMRRGVLRKLVVTYPAFVGDPAVAWTGDRYAVVWATTTRDAMLRFISADGARLGDAIRVGTWNLDGPTYVLSVTAADGVVLVVWSEADDGFLRGRRFELDGTAIDAEPFRFRGNGADVASDGAGLRIVATDECSLVLHSLAPRSPWIDAGTTIASCVMRNLKEYLARPLLVWDGAEYGVLYDQMATPPGLLNYKPRPFFVRVAPDGTASSPVELAQKYGDTLESWAALGSAEGRYVAVWTGATAGVVMPHGAPNARKALPGARNEYVLDFFWTGNIYVLMTTKGFSLLDSFGLPTGDFHPLREGYFDRGGAGNGRGEALIVHPDPETGRGLVGRILTTIGPKRRAARK